MFSFFICIIVIRKEICFYFTARETFWTTLKSKFLRDFFFQGFWIHKSEIEEVITVLFIGLHPFKGYRFSLITSLMTTLMECLACCSFAFILGSSNYKLRSLGTLPCLALQWPVIKLRSYMHFIFIFLLFGSHSLT